MSDYKLLPCPFCGGGDIRYSVKVKGHFNMVYQVSAYCNDCYSYGPRALTMKSRHDDYAGRAACRNDDKAKQRAAEKWNTRAQLSRQKGE